jgi:hypothetical protein
MSALRLQVPISGSSVSSEDNMAWALPEHNLAEVDKAGLILAKRKASDPVSGEPGSKEGRSPWRET